MSQHKRTPLYLLNDRMYFPPLNHANEEGLLAIGGDLSPERLLLAYSTGIFPWFNEDALILWWSPNPRMVLYPEKIKVSKSMRKVMRNNDFTLTIIKTLKELLNTALPSTERNKRVLGLLKT